MSLWGNTILEQNSQRGRNEQLEIDERLSELEKKKASIEKIKSETRALSVETLAKQVKLYESLCVNGKIDDDALDIFRECLLSL
jgi:hypothetical protein